ncbi:MAG: carboxymuconolactone decarboxylase family protein [Bacteroidota bacterium]|nr:carboxymuconolactone decarboxylase family protein [Bacteroidota bacterium]
MERISFNEAPHDMLQVMRNVEQYVNKSSLDKKLLELLRFRVSQINSCAYCLDMHFKEAMHAGEDAKRLYSLSAWRETPYYSLKEQAALAFAETLTRLPADEKSDHIHHELLQYFSKEEIAFLTLAIAQINSWNRLTRSFGTIPGNYKVREAEIMH